MELDVNRYSKLLVLMLFFVVSCASGTGTMRVFVREGVDISYIKRVAVLRFENHTRDKFAAERLRDIVANEILALGLFDVVDKSIVDVVLNEEVGKKEVSLDKGTMRRIAKRLGVQALVLGSVDDYRMESKGTFSYPVVALTLRLVDGRSGEIIWSASASKTGYSFWGRLFGLKPKDIMEVSFELVHSMLKRLK
ncbi:MAG: hypothetical protein GXO44_05495 [Deferribacteres bacterium]|nr:hypothetical protein [Deferribacteres bacterium]